MSKPLPTQNTFAGVAPPWSLTQLDANFTNVWNAIGDYGTYSLFFADTGAVNALVVTPAAGLTLALFTGLTLDVQVANTTTTATPTLNANSTGAKTLVDAAGNALVVGALIATGIYRVVYDGTNYRVQNPSLTRSESQSKFKASNTTRSSTTVLANDPDLAIALGGAGTYIIQAYFCFSFGASSGSLQANVNYSGTFTSASSSYDIPYTGGPQTLSPTAISATVTGGGFADLTSSAVTSSALITGVIVTTASGTLGIAWAQNTSNASGVTVRAGSWLKVTQIG